MSKTKTKNEIIKFKMRYYQMINNIFISTKKLSVNNRKSNLIIIEVNNIEELSLLLEAQNNNNLNNILTELNIRKSIKNNVHQTIV